MSLLDTLKREMLWKPGEQLRLHLGCGGQHFDGYINIDYPQTSHNVMTVKPDLEADIVALSYSENTVDEIRLHHVFEHFNRVVALGLLIRWHQALKPGGTLHLETPDVLATASAASGRPVAEQIALMRHVEGDQAAGWAYHIGQWFPARFEHVLERLGFTGIKTESTASAWHSLPIHNVTVTATKHTHRTSAQQLEIGYHLLAESMVSPDETATLDVWKKQLTDFMADGQEPHPPRSDRSTMPAAGTPQVLSALLNQMVAAIGKEPSIGSIHSFNPNNRDAWVKAVLARIKKGARVLDVGAGSCPYKADLAHTKYESHDFKQYDGYIDAARGEGLYGSIDHISDIVALPVADKTYDAVLCTEVLEHVPEPLKAVAEMARVLKKGGQMILTAPLGSGLHQEPYHFYGGYTPHWYRRAAENNGLEVIEISPNGGFYRHLAQECARVAWLMPQHRALHGDHADAAGLLFGELLPRYLAALDDACLMPEFTVGYHVILRRK